MKKTIGNIVRAKRESLGMTVNKLASAIKISSGYLSHIERNDLVQVSEGLASKLEKRLKCKIKPLIDQHNVHVYRLAKTRKNKSKKLKQRSYQ